MCFGDWLTHDGLGGGDHPSTCRKLELGGGDHPFQRNRSAPLDTDFSLKILVPRSFRRECLVGLQLMTEFKLVVLPSVCQTITPP